MARLSSFMPERGFGRRRRIERGKEECETLFRRDSFSSKGSTGMDGDFLVHFISWS